MSTSDPIAPDRAAVLDDLVRERRTVKLLADAPLDVPDERATIAAIVACAGWAPFHRAATVEADAADGMRAVVPWRVRVLDVAACRALRAWVGAQGDTSAVPRLLAACTALAVVTWLPDAPAEGVAVAPPVAFAGTLDNMEHVAAAAAAVQSMLLAATARGVRTFWASGGPLRRRDALELLGVAPREILLGAVYLSVGEPAGADPKPGGMRERRGEPDGWSRWVDAAEIARAAR